MRPHKETGLHWAKKKWKYILKCYNQYCYNIKDYKKKKERIELHKFFIAFDT